MPFELTHDYQLDLRDDEMWLESLEYSEILAIFDQLVLEGVLHYHDSQVTTIIDKGFKLDFVVTQTQVAKYVAESHFPRAEESHELNTSIRPRCFGPGSDIAFEDVRLLLGAIRGTHLLVLNKFPTFRPQFLLLTMNSYRRQSEALDVPDLLAALHALKVLNQTGSQHFAFYNCGKAAGSSRDHKHIQILPKAHDLFPDREDYDSRRIPYAHFVARLHGSAESELFELYRRLLNKATGCLLDPVQASIGAHNAILTEHWLLVIPRRSAELVVPTPNSCGMMGSIWLPDGQKIDAWKKCGLSDILQQCGVPLTVMPSDL